MVRIPTVVVALAVALACAAVSFWVALWASETRVLVALLPVVSGLSGFIAARGADRPAPVPGVAVGLLALAVRAGLGLGLFGNLFVLVAPQVALLELIAAITGGLLGTLLARRSAAEAPLPNTQPLS